MSTTTSLIMSSPDTFRIATIHNLMYSLHAFNYLQHSSQVVPCRNIIQYFIICAKETSSACCN